MARIYQVNIGTGGIPKNPVDRVRVTTERLIGDDWTHKKYHGGPDQAVCLYAMEAIKQLQDEGYMLFPGAMGENITTEGLDFRALRIGDQLEISDNLLVNVVLQITKPRVPCTIVENAYGAGLREHLWDKKMKDNDPTSEYWGLSGFYARVLQEGQIAPGNRIKVRKE